LTTTESAVYFDPFDLAIKADPYHVYQRLRDEAPLYYNEQHDFYLVSRFDDMQRLLTDRGHFINAHGETFDVIRSGVVSPPGLFICEDAPQHTRHRAIVSILFTAKAMSALEPQAHDFCSKTLDDLVGAGGFDFVRDIGSQVPMRMIGNLVGIPEQDQVALRDQMEKGMQRAYNADEAPLALMEMLYVAFGDYVEWRAKHPSDDLMTQLLNAEFEDERGVTRKLSREEVLTFLILIASAGNDTTNRLIGWIGKVLGDNPDQRQLLNEDPTRIPNAIEEILRLQPPSYHIARYVAKDAEFHGQTVPAGSMIMCLPGAAHRDDRHFKDPETCDVLRTMPRTMTFGFGVHHCLGAALARLEGRIVLEEVLKRFPNWEVDEPNTRMTPGFITRGWEAMPVLV
jgi:cytochrome P450